MEEQTKKRNTWWTLILVALALVGVLAIVFWVSSAFGAAEPEGPEIQVPPPPGPGVPSATALEAINIRSGPGTQFPSFGVAPRETTGEVIGVNSTRSWWVVKVPANVDPGEQGWVSGQFVKVSNADNVPVFPDPPLPPSVQLPVPPIALPYAQALDVIFIRTGPGVNFPAYGLAPKGATGEVLGVSADRRWWVVRIPTTLASSGQGWVSADWVRTSGTENAQVVPAP